MEPNDPNTTPSPPVATPPAPAPSDPVSEGGRRYAEKVVEKFGGDPAAVTGAPSEPAAAPTAAPAPAPAPKPRSAKEIDSRFHERVSRAKRLEEAEHQNALLTAALQRFLPKDEPKEDPEPDFDADPKGWYKWQLRQELKPVVETATEQRRREEERVRGEEQVESTRAALKSRSEMMAFAEEEHLATEDGQGYNQRLEAYSKRVFQRFLNLGHSEEEAAKRTFRQLDNLVEDGLRAGHNPATYLDAWMRDELGSAAPAPAAPPAPPAPRPSPAIAAANAAAASGVAGSLSQSAPAPQPARIGAAKAATTTKKLKASLENVPGGGTWKDRLRRMQNG